MTVIVALVVEQIQKSCPEEVTAELALDMEILIGEDHNLDR
jgi:hypothetical protein